MINEVKQAIQSYYSQEYIFWEFLKSGGWQQQADYSYSIRNGQRHRRWVLEIDGLRFEVDHTTGLATDEHQDPENVFVRILRPYSRDFPLSGNMVRIYEREQVEGKIRTLMINTYHSNTMRGRDYNALI